MERENETNLEVMDCGVTESGYLTNGLTNEGSELRRSQGTERPRLWRGPSGVGSLLRIVTEKGNCFYAVHCSATTQGI